MRTAPFVVLFLDCLLAGQQPAVTGGRPDSITLDIGTVLDGRIRQETADYVEIEIAPGTVVGFPKSRTVRIVRGEAAATAVPEDAAFAPLDAWSAVHDADGIAVGWLHETRTLDVDRGDLRYGEEWSFRDGDEVVELTVLEVDSRVGAPVSCFSHERVRSADGARIVRERIVRARLSGRKLVVETSSTSAGNDRRELDAPEGLRFPLSLRHELRSRPAGRPTLETHLLYDPLTDELVRRDYDVGRTRDVEEDGQLVRVRVLEARAAGNGGQTEWLDATSRPVRRELNGASLVAVPMLAAEARAATASGGRIATASVRADATERIALRLPNPAWRFDGDPVADRIVATAPLDDATFALMRLDQLDDEVLAPSALDAVLRWLRQLHPDLQVLERGSDAIRARDAAGARVGWSVASPGVPARPFEARVHVIRDDGGWFATCGAVPKERMHVVAADLDWLLRHVELERAGFAPELTGPLRHE